MSVIGQCCICGAVGELSFEHIPPRKAYNDQRIFEANVQKLVEGKWDGQARPEGKWIQGGAGKYTLCAKCNNETGSWYGSAYVTFARRAMHLVCASNGNLSLAYPYGIYPLRVTKQIMAMFLSACGTPLRSTYPDLVRFVLQREIQHIPHGLRLFAYLLHPRESEAYRQSGMTGVLNDRGQHVFAEIAYPPFGFILTADARPIHPLLLDISFMGQSRFHHREHVYLKMPVLPVVTWLPGDFRTRTEVAKGLAENTHMGQIQLDVLR